MNIQELRNIATKLYNETLDEKFELINQILEDNECFKNMEMEVAFDILKSLGIDDVINTYKELLESNESIIIID